MTTALLYITAPNKAEATSIAQQLIKERLVACVNILPEIQSLYWWNDDVQNDSETAFFAKTTEENISKTIDRIKELHSYECPCVISLPIEKGSPDFLKWIQEQTQKKG